MNKKTCQKLFSVAAVLALCLTASAALAQTRSIPYQGRLEKDGVPSSGDYEMTFSLFDVSAGGTALWSQTSTIKVSGGHFSAVLANIDAAAVAAAELYLSVEVKGPADAAFVLLQNRQRILPSMYALRSAPQTDFYAADRLGVGTSSPQEELSVVGDMSLGGANNNRAYLDATVLTNGSVKSEGTVTWQCPPATTRYGPYCISSANFGTRNFGAAVRVCNDYGMEICPLKALILCDEMHQNVTSGAGCDHRTDTPMVLWTSDVHPATSGTTSVFNHLACYVDNLVQECENSDSNEFFCCKQVSWTNHCETNTDCLGNSPYCADGVCWECLQDTDCAAGSCVHRRCVQ